MTLDNVVFGDDRRKATLLAKGRIRKGQSLENLDQTGTYRRSIRGTRQPWAK